MPSILRFKKCCFAECHAKIITAHIDALPVSKEKKKELLDMVIENIASQKND